MKILRLLAIGVVMALGVAACGGTAVDDTTVSSLVEEGTDQAEDVMSDIEDEIEAVEDAIAQSDASDELQEDFAELRTEIIAALGSLDENGNLTAPDLGEHFDDFQSDLDELGDDVGDEVQTAWDALRTRIESMMS